MHVVKADTIREKAPDLDSETNATETIATADMGVATDVGNHRAIPIQHRPRRSGAPSVLPLGSAGKTVAGLLLANLQEHPRVTALHQDERRPPRQEGTVHPDPNEQFEHINATADRFLATGQPVISVDTKKKELVGNFSNAGREWQPKATPPAVRVHDFPSDAEGKAIPYGVYDMARNEAWVSVGCDHDTPTFAVASIRHWWQRMGQSAYPDATTLYITADAGGSNGYRLRGWKHELQKLADETRLTIQVSHFPPCTSKCNKVEHRLFCHITANWRGTPLTTYETIVDRIGNTRTEAGLQVQAELDSGQYPIGVTVTKSEMDVIALVPDEFHGDWNYKLVPR